MGTHTLEAEYLLGTPRRHYEAVFGRAVPLDEELDSLEKRTVRHGLEIERMDRFIKQVKQEEVNNPVVHEAIYNDKIYGHRMATGWRSPLAVVEAVTIAAMSSGKPARPSVLSLRASGG